MKNAWKLPVKAQKASTGTLQGRKETNGAKCLVLVPRIQKSLSDDFLAADFEILTNINSIVWKKF